MRGRSRPGRHLDHDQGPREQPRANSASYGTRRSVPPPRRPQPHMTPLEDGHRASAAMSPKWGAIAAGLIFLLAITIPTALIEYSLLNQKRAAAQQASERTARQIGQQLARGLSPTYALGALVRQGNGAIRDFDNIAREFIALTPGLASLQLAPGGVIQHFVPLAGNEKAIGHNLLTDEKRNREARLAVETGRLTLAGPFELIQGGIAVIGRLPIFLDTPEPKTFWGFTSALIRVPEFLATTQLNAIEAEGYSFELWRIHPDSGERHVFARSGSPLMADPITSVIDVPNGRWMLSLTPAAGWVAVPRAILEIAVILILASLVGWFTKRNLAQRRAAEMALIASQERFRLFMDNSPTTAWIKDEVGRYVYLSRAFEQRFGARTEDWLGKTDAQLWPPDTAAEFRENDLAVLASGQPMQVTEVTGGRGGSSCHWLNTKFPFEDAAGRRYVAGIGLDISERKAAEEGLRHSEERFRRIFTNNMVAMGVWTKAGAIVEANDALLDLIGYSRDELERSAGRRSRLPSFTSGTCGPSAKSNKTASARPTKRCFATKMGITSRSSSAAGGSMNPPA
jgi:PAS domain S-box-containing protein